MLEVCEVPEIINTHQWKKTNLVPPLAGIIPRNAADVAPHWQGGDGESPPFCVEQKNRFYQQIKTKIRTLLPPRWYVVSNAVPQAKLLSGRESIGHRHPTHLKRKTRLFREEEE